MDKTILQVVGNIRGNIRPDVTGLFTVKPIKMKDKDVIEAKVKEGTLKPYYLADKGLKPSGVYIRVGNASVQATPEHILKMIRESSGNKYIEGLSLNQELTFSYADKVFAEHNISFNDNNKRTLGLIRADGEYTNLALLLSDQCQHTIKAAIFQGTTRTYFKDRKEFSGSIFQQLDEVLAYIKVYNKVASTFEGVTRIDHSDYPEIAIREALLNAIIHREYALSGSILVSLYDDRLDIMSLGGIVEGVTQKLMLNGISQTRNEKLAAIFHRLQYVEAYGTGIPRIFEQYGKGKEKPTMPVIDDGFLISLPNRNYNKTITLSEIKPADQAKKITPKEEQILDYFKDREFTKEEASKLLSLSLSGTYKLLSRMVEKNLLTEIKRGKEYSYLTK